MKIFSSIREAERNILQFYSKDKLEKYFIGENQFIFRINYMTNDSKCFLLFKQSENKFICGEISNKLFNEEKTKKLTNNELKKLFT